MNSYSEKSVIESRLHTKNIDNLNVTNGTNCPQACSSARRPVCPPARARVTTMTDFRKYTNCQMPLTHLYSTAWADALAKACSNHACSK